MRGRAPTSSRFPRVDLLLVAKGGIGYLALGRTFGRWDGNKAAFKLR